MSKGDLERMQRQRPFLNIPTGGLLPPPCNHQGYIVPLVFLPQEMEMPGKNPGDPPRLEKFFVTQTARCVKCPATFTFGMQPPKEETKDSPAETLMPKIEPPPAGEEKKS